MKDRKSIIIHKDSLNVLNELSNEQAGMLFKAIKSYCKDGTHDLDGLLKAVFIPFENQFNRDNEAYEKKCAANRENGKNGGRPPKNNKPKKPTGLSGLEDKPKKPYSKNKSKSKNDNKNVNDCIDTLKGILENHYKRNFNNISSWYDPIEKLNRLDGVSWEEISNCLLWYSQNIGGKYIPVIESGSSLREKFIKLQNSASQKKEETTSEMVDRLEREDKDDIAFLS